MDDYYNDYFDIDDYLGGVDEVTFQMHGYGGFGCDTLDVKPNEKESKMVIAARKGDLLAIEKILEKEKDEAKRRGLLNHARRWTEVDYRMSGFTKEYEWFDFELDSACNCGFAGPCPCGRVSLETRS